MKEYLKAEAGREKYKLFVINEEDKFLFNIMEKVVNSFEKEFPNFSRDDIVEALKANSMDVNQTYHYLKNPQPSKNIF